MAYRYRCGTCRPTVAARTPEGAAAARDRHRAIVHGAEEMAGGSGSSAPSARLLLGVVVVLVAMLIARVLGH
ncbi:hypothetical protein ACGFWI_37865 [Streptomyces sp. NPDC048434]|uniref:hypothetical protein n=1 Tax=Streptomyces sp. NPDC048434 TaxID=3365549 RepID=UPI003714B8F9